MDKALLCGALLVGWALASIGAVAAYVVASALAYAPVLNVKPVTAEVVVPEEVCRNVKVTRRKPAPADQVAPGTIIGGMNGGSIGHQVAEGSSGKIVPVSRAAANRKNVRRPLVTVTERQCRIVHRVDREIVAYDVRYRLDGKVGIVRMAEDPGPRIPVRDGKLLLKMDSGDVEG